jgi:polyhydroxyalkanoate synthase
MLIGYCLGGLLALALAMRRTADVSGLVFMATPWDFHAGDNSLSRSASQVALMMEPMLQMLGSLPIDAVQTLFYSLDPFHVIEKFLKFADLDQSSDQATAFVALEDWLNDGLAMPAAIARTLMSEWYGANSPAAGAWRVNGQAMRPADLPLPSLVLVPSQDRIVPPPGALALDAVLTNSTAIAVNTGHIGMVSSRRAPAMVWRPLLDWMQQTTGIMPG